MNKFIAVGVILCGALVASISADCIECDSTNDTNCVLEPWLARTTQCTGRCYSRIVDQQTLRGCSDGLDKHVVDSCEASETCMLCTSLGGSCNKDIYPPHRLQCHQCVGGLKSNCSDTATVNPAPCALFNNEDSCFIYKTESTIERGCMSASGKKCSNIAHCFICNGHGCNSANATDAQIPIAPSSASIMRPIMPIFIALCVAIFFAKN